MKIDDLAKKYNLKPCNGENHFGLYKDGACQSKVGEISIKSGWKCCLKKGHEGPHSACADKHDMIVWLNDKLLKEYGTEDDDI